MKKSDILKAILRYLKIIHGCFAWKEHGGMYSTAGVPDVITCIGGRVYAFEVKTEKGKPTALQEAIIRKILVAGGVAVIVRSLDEVRAVINGSLQ
jgi:Holliday junction resolvase - archaeal type